MGIVGGLVSALTTVAITDWTDTKAFLTSLEQTSVVQSGEKLVSSVVSLPGRVLGAVGNVVDFTGVLPWILVGLAVLAGAFIFFKPELLKLLAVFL